MIVKVLVKDKRTFEGARYRDFYSYNSAYKYIKKRLDRVILVKIKIDGGDIIHTLQEFISFMEMEEMS